MSRRLTKLEGICSQEVRDHPKEAEQIIMQWAAEHPQKTMLQRFKELFPHAQLAHDGTPVLCLRDLGWVVQKPECPSKTCTACWNRPYKESEGGDEE